MSWPVFISKTPVDELEKAEIGLLGDRLEVIDRLQSILPGIFFDSEGWASYRQESYSISLRLDSEEEDPRYLMLEIRGSGEAPISIIKAICDQFGAYAMDGDTGQQMNFDEADVASFKAWQAYRDKVVGKEK